MEGGVCTRLSRFESQLVTCHCMTLNKVLNLSVPQLLICEMGITHRVVKRIKLLFIKHSEQT